MVRRRPEVGIAAYGGARDWVALSVDDGPMPDSTPQLLALMRRHGAQANFFVSGIRASRASALVRAMVEEGHEVFGRGWEHIRPPSLGVIHPVVRMPAPCRAPSTSDRRALRSSQGIAMCGRYSITTPAEALSRLFRFSGPLPSLPPRYNVAPTQQVPIVRLARTDGERELVQVRWGLIPFWAKDREIGPKLINARAEEIAKRPAFRAAFRERRCLVPADGFYEWEKKGAVKQPWRVTLEDGEPFAFAGLWERWEKAPDGVPVESCTIVTTAANALVAEFHDRMPVILPADAYPAWLGEDSAAPPELLALLKPYPADAMLAYRVSTAVNNVKNDGPECVEPAT